MNCDSFCWSCGWQNQMSDVSKQMNQHLLMSVLDTNELMMNAGKETSHKSRLKGAKIRWYWFWMENKPVGNRSTRNPVGMNPNLGLWRCESSIVLFQAQTIRNLVSKSHIIIGCFIQFTQSRDFYPRLHKKQWSGQYQRKKKVTKGRRVELSKGGREGVCGYMTKNRRRACVKNNKRIKKESLFKHIWGLHYN